MVWAFALSVGVLFHEFQAGRDPLSWHGLVVVAAVGVFLRPSSLARLLLLGAAFGLELVTDLPDPWNHTVLLGILGWSVVAWWLLRGAPRPSTVDRADVHAGVAPLFRAALVLTWFAAGVAKLNEGFFEPDGCAVWMIEQVPGIAVPSGAEAAAATATVFVELLVPLLLLVRRVRPLGVLLAVGFHIVVAIAGHTAFSGLAFSFYALFLADDVLATARARATSWVARIRVVRPVDTVYVLATRNAWGWAATAPVVLAVVGAPLLLSDGIESQLRRWVPVVGFLGWVGLAGAAVVVAVARSGVRAAFPPVAVPRGAIAFVAMALLFLNAATPYVGLKSLSSFTMYSNLRTEPGRWNHYVVPEDARAFGWQDDIIEILEIDPALADELLIESRGPVMPALRLRVAAEGFEDTAVRYRIDGRTIDAPRLADDPLLGQPVSVAQRFLGGIRPVDPERRCMV